MLLLASTLFYPLFIDVCVLQSVYVSTLLDSFLTVHINDCPRHLPFMLIVEKLYLKFYNYMCVNGYV